MGKKNKNKNKNKIETIYGEEENIINFKHDLKMLSIEKDLEKTRKEIESFENIGKKLDELAKENKEDLDKIDKQIEKIDRLLNSDSMLSKFEQCPHCKGEGIKLIKKEGK